ncbi:MAG TPA: type II toxin-antitoxin system RelE/ParE family toxin [Beijerinckiaceae bacterium]|nr:type II toxin-antitoxin system RelE/ParE family toxin [Beijerinckiaceae bacterium]
MRLEWSVFARADREQIFDYIEAENPRAAAAVDERIRTQTNNLIRFPTIGRSGRVDGTRELAIAHTPYVAVYTVSDEAIRILRVLHGARLWPDETP